MASIAHNDAIMTSMQVADGLIDKMKADTRLSTVEQGYWTELERLITATVNPSADLINHCMYSLQSLMIKAAT